MVKTGTTNDKRDNWTIGGNDNAMVGVWVGNNDNSPMLNVASGISGASPIWHQIIIQVMKGKPAVSFTPTSNVVTAQVDTISGYAAHDNFPSRSESFIKGTEPVGADPSHLFLRLCNSDGKLANPSDIAGGSFHTQEYYKFKENDPTAAAGGPNQWQAGIDAWVNTQTDARYHPPTDYCGSGNPLDVEFTSPHDQDSNINNNFTVNFTANSNSAITESDIKVDNGSPQCNSNSGSNNYTCGLGLSTGVHTIEAEATDAGNHQSSRTITIAVGEPMPTPTPVPTPSPTPTATP
jgi:membrane peptidoglycan carboxypeptidase